MRQSITFTINAGEAWEVKFGTSKRIVTEHPLKSQEFLKNLQLLDKIINRPFLCDKSGKIRPDDEKRFSKIIRLAELIGNRLAEVLGEKGKKQLADAMQQVNVPLFRVAVYGPETDRVLALPWELIHVAGKFPVKRRQD